MCIYRSIFAIDTLKLYQIELQQSKMDKTTLDAAMSDKIDALAEEFCGTLKADLTMIND